MRFRSKSPKDPELSSGSEPSPSPNKASRHFSIGSLIRSKSQRHLTGQSLTAIDEVDETTPTQLRRRHSVTEKVNKLIKRVSRKEDALKGFKLEEGAEPSKHVSSIFVAPMAEESLAELNQQSAIELGLGEDQSLVALPRNTLPPPVPDLPCQKWCPDVIPLKVLTSTRCALLYRNRLIQGHLTISTRELCFQSTATQSRLRFSIHYTDIVAIIPNRYYGSGAIHLATGTRLVKIVNLPQMSTTLQVMMDEWSMHCRCMLLGATHPPIHRPNVDLNEWSDDSFANLSIESITSDLPCGCESHFGEIIMESTLPGAPIVIADMIFGGFAKPNGIFRIFEGAIVDEGPWEGTPRHRMVRISAPNPSKPTEKLRYTTEQTVLRQSADTFVVGSETKPVGMDIADLDVVRVRWCITRAGLKEESSILITGEAEDSKGAIISPQSKRVFVFRVLVGQYEKLFEDIREKLAPPVETEPDQEGLKDKLRQMVIFVIGPIIMESLPNFMRSPRRFLLGIVFLSLFSWLLARWAFKPPTFTVDHLFVEQHVENTIRANQKAMEDAIKGLERIRDRL